MRVLKSGGRIRRCQEDEPLWIQRTCNVEGIAENGERTCM